MPRQAGKFQLQFLCQRACDDRSLRSQCGERADGATKLKDEDLLARGHESGAVPTDSIEPPCCFEAECYGARLLQPGATGEQRGSMLCDKMSERIGKLCKLGSDYVERGAQLKHESRVNGVLAGGTPMHEPRSFFVGLGDGCGERFD